MIVVICGVDASGKATQSKLLAERLKGTRFSFPNYESETGKAILANLKKEWTTTSTDRGDGRPIDSSKPISDDAGWNARIERDRKLNALVFQSLQTVNRIELLPKIHAAMERGPVVFDRYWQSAVVYGTLDGLDPEWLRTVQELPMPKADVNILIDVPIEEGFKRRPERRDRYETNREFLEKVRVEYLRLGESPQSPPVFSAEDKEGNRWWRTKSGWYIVNGQGSIEQVHKRICAVLREHFHGRQWPWHLDTDLNDGSWTPVLGWNGELDQQYPEDGDK